MLTSCCHCSTMMTAAASEARLGNVIQAFRNVPKCVPKALPNRKIKKVETFRDVSIVLKRTETPRKVLHRYHAPKASGAPRISTVRDTQISTVRDIQISTIRHNFVANLDWDGEPLDAERDIGTVRAALDTYSVIVLRNAEVTLNEQITLTKLLGVLAPVTVADMINHHPDTVEALVVSNSGRTPVIGNFFWHSDSSFLPTPNRYTLLHGVVVAENGIGDTHFADLVHAYAEAPEDWKHAMEGAKGVHTYDRTARIRAEVHKAEIEDYSRYPPVYHPVVRYCHGKPALYISDLCMRRVVYDDGTLVPGLTTEVLIEHASQPQFVYCHQWVEGDVVIWDNRRVMHRVGDLPPDVPRVMHRTTTFDVGS